MTGIVLLDLSAAFDLVDPDILCKKLKIYGLDDHSISWFKNYLTNRYQAVWIDHVLSDWKNVDIGVPQGSILGPLLYVIFANELPNIVKSSLDCYCDDSTISQASANPDEIERKLTADCLRIENWMSSNKLKLNSDKTHLVICRRGRCARKKCKTGSCHFT